MVFAPGILRKKIADNVDQYKLVRELDQAKDVLKLIIEGYDEIFPNGPPGINLKEEKLDEEEKEKQKKDPFSGPRANFSFFISFFHRMMSDGPPRWIKPILLMLGYFLKVTKHRCDKIQFAQLGELVVQQFYHRDKKIAHIAE